MEQFKFIEKLSKITPPKLFCSLFKPNVHNPIIEIARLVAELDEKDKAIIFGMIETMLTKKKFKDFFNKNAAML